MMTGHPEREKSSVIRGGLVVVSGPSGSGKTTLCRLMTRDRRVRPSVSVTTRPPRRGEVNGEDYHFTSREEFEAARARGEFAEWANVYGHLYGTLRKPLLEALECTDRIYLLEIDVQGALQLQDEGFTGTYVLVVPPSLAVLRERLLQRGTNDAEDVERRLDEAAREISQKDRYDIVIVNDDLEDAITEIRRCLGLDGDRTEVADRGSGRKQRG